jgi:hypothetical protein
MMGKKMNREEIVTRAACVGLLDVFPTTDEVVGLVINRDGKQILFFHSFPSGLLDALVGKERRRIEGLAYDGDEDDNPSTLSYRLVEMSPYKIPSPPDAVPECPHCHKAITVDDVVNNCCPHCGAQLQGAFIETVDTSGKFIYRVVELNGFGQVVREVNGSGKNLPQKNIDGGP